MTTLMKYIEAEGQLANLLRAAALEVDLTEPEFHCYCDANNSTMLDAVAFEAGFGLNVADSGPDGLAEKWQVNLPALSEKLDGLTPLQKCAVLAAFDGFFHRAKMEVKPIE